MTLAEPERSFPVVVPRRGPARVLTAAPPPSILEAMWGYAEGDATLVAIVVVVVAITALAFVGRRIGQSLRDRGR